MLVNVCACHVVYLLLFVIQFVIACLEGNNRDRQTYRCKDRHTDRGI